MMFLFHENVELFEAMKTISVIFHRIFRKKTPKMLPRSERRYDQEDILEADRLSDAHRGNPNE